MLQSITNHPTTFFSENLSSITFPIPIARLNVQLPLFQFCFSLCFSSLSAKDRVFCLTFSIFCIIIECILYLLCGVSINFISLLYYKRGNTKCLQHEVSVALQAISYKNRTCFLLKFNKFYFTVTSLFTGS